MRYYFYLYVVLLFFFIVIMSYYNTLHSNKDTFIVKQETNYVLLGDSIFKNNSYVSNGENIEDIFRDKGINVISFSRNDATITNILSQVSEIPLELNMSTTKIFLSAGGNDILSYYENRQHLHSSILRSIFKKYAELVQSIQIRLPNAKLYLLDIYYPTHKKYSEFIPIIQQWNQLLYHFANKNQIPVIRISRTLTKDTDFTFEIEPSYKGGEKIVNLLLNS